MSRVYYTLTFRRGDALHRKGEIFKNDEIPLSIGQSCDCDLRLPEDPEYECVNYITILKNPEEEGWRIVRCNDIHEIFVNGQHLNYVHYLSDNDRITFEGQQCELSFNIKKDNAYSGNKLGVELRKINRRIYSVVWGSIAVLLIGFVFLQIITDKSIVPGNIVEDDILKVRLESIVLQQVDVIDGKERVVGLDSMEIDKSGTGFLTDCGKFITARHCIEPWLDESPDNISSRMVDMALEAYNYFSHTNSTYRRLISRGAVYRINEADGGMESLLFRFSSDTFLFSTRNDCVENVGSVTSPKYWISLGHVYKISSIGDIACFNVPYKGRLQLANKEQMFALKKNREIAVNGIPSHESKHFFCSGRLLNSPVISPDGRIVRCIEVSGDEVDKGLSGGPLFVKSMGKVYVIGIVSKRSSYNSEKIHAVPITELKNVELRKWDE